MTKIKICGLSRPEDIQAANRLKPDYIGFVFAKSKRQVSAETARQLKDMLDPAIPAVGVFVNAEPETIRQYANERLIDLVQLHGEEDDGYIRRLRQDIAVPIIKAIRVQEERDVQKAQDLACDFLLYDTYQKGIYGGGGVPFDWRLLSGGTKPYFLAGGLKADNLKKALAVCTPYCVDLSSGVESGGRKDPAKMEECIRSVRNVERKI